MTIDTTPEDFMAATMLVRLMTFVQSHEKIWPGGSMPCERALRPTQPLVHCADLLRKHTSKAY